jgi:hypothetical protein
MLTRAPIRRFAAAASIAAVSTCAAAMLGACGAQTANEHAQAAPARYPGPCALGGIEEVPAPSDQQSDSVAMVARYRVDIASGKTQAPTVAAQVSRARDNDPQLQLEGHPTVVCTPDQTASRGRGAETETPAVQPQTAPPAP